jgi:hypothetical protein
MDKVLRMRKATVMQQINNRCAYCGIKGVPLEREHVIPKGLYPVSKKHSTIQRLIVLACSICNRSWSDDEAHFRNVLLIAGEPNAAVHELWKAKAWPSFGKADGKRRLRDLAEQMKPVIVDGQERSAIYPGNDPRVIRVIRKIIRGLSSFHGLESAVPETRVWADVLKYRLPEELAQNLKFDHREEDICRYEYGLIAEPEIDSL